MKPLRGATLLSAPLVLALMLIGLLVSFASANPPPALNLTSPRQPLLTPTLSPTPCPSTTPEPLRVEPVTSPTGQLSQAITVGIGNGDAVTVTAESGVFAATGNFNAFSNPAVVTITLLAGTVHHLTVQAHVRPVQQGGCTYGNYTLVTSVDKFGAPLTIVQQSGAAAPLYLPFVFYNCPPPATPTVGPPRPIQTHRLPSLPTCTPGPTNTPLPTQTGTPPTVGPP